MTKTSRASFGPPTENIGLSSAGDATAREALRNPGPSFLVALGAATIAVMASLLSVGTIPNILVPAVAPLLLAIGTSATRPQNFVAFFAAAAIAGALGAILIVPIKGVR
jgi:hypothetical protein